MGNHEDAESGIKFEREYNQICGKMLQEEREKRGISREELARGILSKTALGHMETGRIGWTKLPGDTLMHRMGVGTDYFEVVASAEELDRWRRREDICLLLPARPGEAVGKLREYRHAYGKREPLEEQFLCKAEALLALLDWRRDGEEADAARLSDMARRAVHCTVPEGWERGMEDLWLAPSELEAVLLEAAARMGARVCTSKEGIYVQAPGRPAAIELVTAPYPGFPTDLQSVVLAVETKGRGVSRIRETIFENRFRIVEELRKMGASVELCSPREASVKGVETLRGADLVARELRGGAALVAAGLMAEGETFVEGCAYIYRGYENIGRDFRELGARVASV